MKFSGIIPPLLTPFDRNEDLDLNALGPLVERLLESGIGGLFLCGSTGEWWSLSEDERERIVDTVVEVVSGRTPLMVHVGSTSTRSAVRLARHAERAGADAVSALPPLGFAFTPDQVWSYFGAIADASSLPLYLYHLPQTYGDLIGLDRFVEALDTMPTLAGVKFSSYRIDDLIALSLKAGDRLNILSGCSEQLLSAMACGAEGSICTWYNLFPRLASAIVQRVEANDVAGARELQQIIVAFAKLASSMHLGNLKWLIGRRGIDVGIARRPLPSPDEAVKQALLPRVEATGVLEWCL